MEFESQAKLIAIDSILNLMTFSGTHSMNATIQLNFLKLVFASSMLFMSGCGNISAQTQLEPARLGDRAILVTSDSLHPYRENPLTAQVAGAVLKVVALTPDGVVVKDLLGMAVVARKNLILVRQSDPFGQIDRRVAAEHQPFAKAQLEDLKNVSEGFEALTEFWDRQPNHDMCRLKIAEELLCFGERPKAFDLFIGFQKDSPAWPVAQSIKASIGSNAVRELTQLIEQHPKRFVAYQLLVNHLLDQAQQAIWERKFDKSQIEKTCRVAIGLISQMEKELPERTEAATLRARLCSVAWQAEIPVAANYSQDTIRSGYTAMTQDPYDLVLMVELANCLVANGRYDEAAQLTLKAAKRFPRNIKPLEKLVAIAVRLPDAVKKLPFSERTTEELLASDWQSIFNGVDKTFDLDIPLKQAADQAMPITRSNGNGRRGNGILLNPETGQSALEILCADDNSDYLRFVDANTTGIDFERLSERQLLELVSACVQNDSVHALKFLEELKLLDRLPETARMSVVQAAIEQKALGCAFVLVKSSWELSAKRRGDMANLLGCEKQDLESCLETKLVDHEIDLAIDSIDKYSSQVENCMAGLKLANEQIKDIRNQAQTHQTDYYRTPAAPVFIPSQHVYSGTSEAEQGVRLRQAIQRDVDLYSRPDRNDSISSYQQQFLKQAIEYRHDFNRTIAYCNRRIHAQLARFQARVEAVVATPMNEVWHDQLRQRMLE